MKPDHTERPRMLEVVGGIAFMALVWATTIFGALVMTRAAIGMLP